MVSRVPNAPPDDIFKLNLSPLKLFLVDLPKGGMRGTRRAQEGFTSVVQEINGNQPKYGARAGITATHFAKFGALNGQYAQIEEQLPLAEKAHEILKESLAHVDNLRHRLATTFADSAEAHAHAEGGAPTLLTAYEKTIAYRSVIADKGVKTRKKKQEAKKARGGAEEPKEPAGAPPAKEASEPAGAPSAKGKAGKSAEGASRIPNPPPDIIFTINVEALREFLVDLPPGAMIGMRRVQDGWEGVRHEITSSQEAFGDRAGITSDDFMRFAALDGQYDQILKQIPAVEKAVEILKESLAHVDHLRHRLIVAFADAAESHAKTEGGDSTLLTAYEKTIAYRGVVASKAAKTRKKKSEEGEKAQLG